MIVTIFTYLYLSCCSGASFPFPCALYFPIFFSLKIGTYQWLALMCTYSESNVYSSAQLLSWPKQKQRKQPFIFAWKWILTSVCDGFSSGCQYVCVVHRPWPHQYSSFYRSHSKGKCYGRFWRRLMSSLCGWLQGAPPRNEGQHGRKHKRACLKI